MLNKKNAVYYIEMSIVVVYVSYQTSQRFASSYIKDKYKTDVVLGYFYDFHVKQSFLELILIIKYKHYKIIA